jgi:TetR/AcrR family transcriptional regulator
MARHKEIERRDIKEKTRTRLLTAATSEFAAKGYNGANINSISQSAGFAKGTVYNHFESKRGLMLELIQEIAAAHLAFIAERVRSEEAADQRLFQFFEAGSDFVESHLPQAQIMVNNVYGPDPEFRQETYQAYLPMFDLVGVDIVSLGIEQGLFRQVEITSTAALLMNFYLGVASQVDQFGRPWIPPLQVSDFILKGLHA